MTEHDDEQHSEAIGEAIRQASLSVSAPPGLRAEIDTRLGQGRARRHSRQLVAAGLTVAAVIAAGATVVIALEASSSGPTVSSAVSAALGPTPDAIHPGDPGDAGHPALQIDGVSFPGRGEYASWSPIASRSQSLSGRHTVTVAYRTTNGARVGYTIVGGTALPVPTDSTRVRDGLVDTAVLKTAEGAAVTWRADGHTCVLASRTATVQELLQLVGETS